MDPEFWEDRTIWQFKKKSQNMNHQCNDSESESFATIFKKNQVEIDNSL